MLQILFNNFARNNNICTEYPDWKIKLTNWWKILRNGYKMSCSTKRITTNDIHIVYILYTVLHCTVHCIGWISLDTKVTIFHYQILYCFIVISLVWLTYELTNMLPSLYKGQSQTKGCHRQKAVTDNRLSQTKGRHRQKTHTDKKTDIAK